ncbi:MAG: tetratricopeptide repeat protein [Anaerolineae bacterium]|nr:tetratricopeptide repeat protein [Anaerolineae bacterium]
MIVDQRPDPARREQANDLLNQGASLLERGQGKQAITRLEQARRLDPDNVAVLINLGGAYILAGRHQDAIAPLEAARDLEPHNPMIWTNLGAAYLGNPLLASDGAQMQAIRAFERAIGLNPVAPNVHYNLGLIFIDRGDRERAQAAFRSALQVNPHDRDARYWLRKLAEPAHPQEEE